METSSKKNQRTSVWKVIKMAAGDFAGDDATTLAAGLAFYTSLSLSPLLMILISVASFLGSETQDKVVERISQTVGPKAGETIRTIVENAQSQPSQGTLSAVLGFAVLLFSATGVFAQLQASMNRIWHVKAKPGQGIKGALRKRLLSLGMILAIGFVLLVSLVLTAALESFLSGQGVVWTVVNFVVSVAVYVFLFGAMFKILPDVHLEWRHVWRGALLTGILFAIGKFLIGLYLGSASVGSSFGAAGSLVVLLVWVYYSAIIVFFGTELTQAWLRARGERIEPEPQAEWGSAEAAARWGDEPERNAEPETVAANRRS